jgi:hypothetical protein
VADTVVAGVVTAPVALRVSVVVAVADTVAAGVVAAPVALTV